MARIEGVDLPRNKRTEVGLTYLFGVGPTRARQILAAMRMLAFGSWHSSSELNPQIFQSRLPLMVLKWWNWWMPQLRLPSPMTAGLNSDSNEPFATR